MAKKITVLLLDAYNNRDMLRTLIFALLLAVLAIGGGRPVAAHAADGAALRQPAGPDDPWDANELTAFLDDFITWQLETYNIPGAAAVVVVDGEVRCARGYGYLDSTHSRAVEPERTLFHVGSISKLFTWTAVMQLVEQGKLDLHTDINAYLDDLEIPATFPEPVTLAHLLTHTAGFDDKLGNLFRLGPGDGLPLDVYVQRHLPARVYPPGEIIAYSNYSAALAGHIVAEVSGMPYEEYVARYIFAPLEMERTTAREPVPAAWQDDLARGHYQDLQGEPFPLEEALPSAPVVGISATVTDIARFMIAHLQDGRYGDARILEETTARQMHAQQFTHDPRIAGVTYGFVEWERHGQHLLWHGGSTGFFEGMLMLLPEHDVGAYVIYNRKVEVETGREFRQAFMDHYFPTEPPHAEPLEDFQARVRLYAGAYRESRWAYSTADKIVYMFTRYYPATANPDGTLTIEGADYIEVEPAVFKEVGGEGTLLFHEKDGADVGAAHRRSVLCGFYDFDPHKVFIRLAWYETRAVQFGILGSCMMLFFSALMVQLPKPSRRGEAETYQVLRWLGGLNLGYLPVMLIIGVTTVVQYVPSLAFLAPLVLLVEALALVIAIERTLALWRRGTWSVGRRVHYTLVVVATLVFLVWLSYWKMLGLWGF